MNKDERVTKAGDDWIRNVFEQLDIPLDGAEGKPEHLTKVLFIEVITKCLAAGSNIGLKHAEMEKID